MNTPTRTMFAAGRDREARTITTGLTAVCLLGFVSAVIPGVEHAINLGVVALGVLAVLTVLIRFGLRRLRERREDREDEITAAAWRATHQHPRDQHGVTRAGVA